MSEHVQGQHLHDSRDYAIIRGCPAPFATSGYNVAVKLKQGPEMANLEIKAAIFYANVEALGAQGIAAIAARLVARFSPLSWQPDSDRAVLRRLLRHCGYQDEPAWHAPEARPPLLGTPADWAALVVSFCGDAERAITTNDIDGAQHALISATRVAIVPTSQDERDGEAIKLAILADVEVATRITEQGSESLFDPSRRGQFGPLWKAVQPKWWDEERAARI